MVNENIFRKLRITLTRIFAVMLTILILITSSHWEDIGILSTIFFISGTALVGIATIGRIWCALYISGYKSKILITSGPYSMCRNPLYFFSMIGSLGVGLASETLTIPFILMVGFALYYPYVIQREQRRLSALYGDKYKEYCDKTPSFIPSLSLLYEPDDYIVKPVTFRKNIFDTLGFIWIVGLLELIEGLHEANIIPVLFSIY